MRADGGCGCGGKPRAKAWTELGAEAPRAEDLRADGAPGFRCAGVPRPRQRPPAEPTGCGCEAAVEAPAAPDAARPRGGIGQIRPREDDDERVVHFGRTSRSAFRRAARHTAALYGVAAPPRWKDAPVPLGAGPARTTPAKMLAAAAAWKNKATLATQGGPEGFHPLGEFTVWIGDAKFVVPASFYYSGEYREVLPTEDDALEYIWPIQTHYRAMGKGLTTEEMHGLWGCIDLQPDEGWFFRDVDSRGIGGYAGRALYWATQYLAMFWEYTRDGEVVDGEDTPCKGIADAGDALFREGTKAPPWHVIGGGFGWDEVYWRYPDRASCLSTDGLGVIAPAFCTDVHWDESGVVPALDESGAYRLTAYRTNPVEIGFVDPRIDSAGSGTRQVLYYGVDFPVGTESVDPGGSGAYSDPYPCQLVAKARTVGQSGLVADAYLHWAHVAAALALSCDSFTAAPYLEAAILLGRYAANAVVEFSSLLAHEVSHRYTENVSHHDGKCCMCAIAEAWATGVRALLGLPDSTGAGTTQKLLATPEFVLVRDAYCSTDPGTGATHPLFSWYAWYGSPGESYGERGFTTFDVGRVVSSVEESHV